MSALWEITVKQAFVRFHKIAPISQLKEITKNSEMNFVSTKINFKNIKKKVIKIWVLKFYFNKENYSPICVIAER